MDKIKLKRLNNLFQIELSKIFMLEVKNPLLKEVCITSCNITNDLSYCKVYYTCFNENPKEVQKELRDSASFLRTMLCDKVDIRHTPELVFEYDNSIEYGKKIEEVINKIHEKDSNK